MGKNTTRSTCAGLLCLLAVAVGCRVGPDYAGPPMPPLHPTWRELPDPAVHDDYRAVADWWTGFRDPVLDALVELASEGNLDLRVAALRIVEARAQRGAVRANLFPEVLQDATYKHIKLPQLDSSDQWSFGLNGSWEIDVFGRLHRLVEAADGDVAVTVEDCHDTMVILLADVATNYVDARAYQRRLEISRRNLETQRRTLELTERRFAAELTGELDVAQARANLESTAAGIPSLEAGYQRSLNRLSVLLGFPPGEVDRLMAEPAPIPDPPEEIAIGIPADLLRRRPDIRRAEREIAAQTARIGAAVGEMYPKFTILGSFSLDAQDFSRLFDADAIGAGVGPRMQWNVLNFGRLRCNVQVQGARQQQRVVQYQAAVLRAAEEVDNALVSYAREKQRGQHLNEQVKANRRAVQLSRLRYAGGDVDFQRVLDSERSLLLAEDQLASSDANVAVSLIQLYRALGGAWQLPGEEAEIGPRVPAPGTAPESIETPPPDEGNP